MKRMHHKCGALTILILALLLAMLLVAGPAGALTKTPYESTTTLLESSADWMMHPPQERFVDRAISERIRIDHVLWQEASDPRMTGLNVVTIYLNMRWPWPMDDAVSADGRGTETFYVEGGGVWEGVSTNRFDGFFAQAPDGTWYVYGTSVIETQWRGVSGPVAGLRAESTAVEQSFIDGSYTITAGGHIIEH